jgi:hypothetical protein
MYTTLLADDTDALFDSTSIPLHRLLGFVVIKRDRPENHRNELREHFSDGITTSGVTVGNSSTPGFIEFLPTGNQSTYTLANDAGTLTLLQDVDSILSISPSKEITLSPLQMTNSPDDTTELVPILVDQNGKLYRGQSVFQTISQLLQRVQALEQAGSVQVEQRVSQVESLVQTIRNRYNALRIDSSQI